MRSASSPCDAAPMCCVVVCEQPAAGIGPHSRQPMCHQHLSGDVQQVRNLEKSLLTDLKPYSAVSLASLEVRERQFAHEVQCVIEAFADMRQGLTNFEATILQRLREAHEAVRTCVAARRDMQEFDNELAQANAAGDVTEVCGLVLSMELSMDALRDDFRRVEELSADTGTRIISDGVRELISFAKKHTKSLAEKAGSSASSISVGAPPERTAATMARDSGNRVPVNPKSTIPLDSYVQWVASCNDTHGFVADSSGRVVPAESAGDRCLPLPQPVLFATFRTVDPLIVTSVDGAQRFKCFCAVNSPSNVCGLQCYGQQLFIAQPEAVTVADLSGRIVRNISSDVLGNGARITGICGSANVIYLSSGSRIAAVSKATGVVEKMFDFPGCYMTGLSVVDGKIFGLEDSELRKISVDSGESLATYPLLGAGSQGFRDLVCVTVDSRGRIFVSDRSQHTVYAVSDDGTALPVMGSPGERGRASDRLNYPSGLTTVVTDSQSEQLVVADRGNKRLLVFDV